MCSILYKVGVFNVKLNKKETSKDNFSINEVFYFDFGICETSRVDYSIAKNSGS